MTTSAAGPGRMLGALPRPTENLTAAAVTLLLERPFWHRELFRVAGLYLDGYNAIVLCGAAAMALVALLLSGSWPLRKRLFLAAASGSCLGLLGLVAGSLLSL